MPRVPNLPKEAKSPLSDVKVTPENILMAAAETYRLGRLTEPDDKSGRSALRPGTKAKGLR